jgi:hypothetical protein
MHHKATRRQLTASATTQEGQYFIRARGGCRSLVTLGLPRKPKGKKVHFEPPLPARFVTPEGSASTACEVTTVWETGARLRAKHPPPFQFVLLFASSPIVVSRVCKRVRCRGEDVWVDYVRQRPCYSMEVDR